MFASWMHAFGRSGIEIQGGMWGLCGNALMLSFMRDSAVLSVCAGTCMRLFICDKSHLCRHAIAACYRKHFASDRSVVIIVSPCLYAVHEQFPPRLAIM